MRKHVYVIISPTKHSHLGIAMNKNTTIYSRVDHCPFCVKAKALLNEKEIEFNEIVIGKDISKEDFISMFKESYGTDVTTVPQIIMNDEHVGGYTELSDRLSKKELVEDLDMGEFAL